MKVKLLKQVGIHDIGTIINVDDVIVNQLETSGNAERYIELEIPSEENQLEVPKRKGNPNWAKK